jgi:hypothetical protein
VAARAAAAVLAQQILAVAVVDKPQEILLGAALVVQA